MHQNVPRKHHYVPRFYQSGFADCDELLWVYDRKMMKYRRLHPKVVCCAQDFYAIKPEGAPLDSRVESEYLSKVDSTGATVIRALSNGKQPDGSEIRALAIFAAHQFTRTPSYRKAISRVFEQSAGQMLRLAFLNVERATQSIDHLRVQTGYETPLTPESMVEAVNGNQLLIRATEGPFLNQLIEQAANIADVIEALDWQLLVSPHTTGFITCDDPVVIVPPLGYDGAQCGVGFATPQAVKYFPLTRQLCLRLGNADYGLQWREVDGETVRVINQNIAATSERFILGPSLQQLESVISRSHCQSVDLRSRFVVEVVEEGPNAALEMFGIRPNRWFHLKVQL